MIVDARCPFLADDNDDNVDAGVVCGIVAVLSTGVLAVGVAIGVTVCKPSDVFDFFAVHFLSESVAPFLSLATIKNIFFRL